MNILRRASTTRIIIAGALIVLAAGRGEHRARQPVSRPHPAEALAGLGDPSRARGPARGGRHRADPLLEPSPASGALPDSQPSRCSRARPAGSGRRAARLGSSSRLTTATPRSGSTARRSSSMTSRRARRTRCRCRSARTPTTLGCAGPRRALDRAHPAGARQARGPRVALRRDRRRRRRPAGLHGARLAEARRRPPRRGRARVRRQPRRAAPGRRPEPGRLTARSLAAHGHGHQLRKRAGAPIWPSISRRAPRSSTCIRRRRPRMSHRRPSPRRVGAAAVGRARSVHAHGAARRSSACRARAYG